MSEEEEANEIISRYVDVIDIDGIITDTIEIANKKILRHHKQCVKCALIHVQGIIDELSEFIGVTSKLMYWNKVKQIIEQKQ